MFNTETKMITWLKRLQTLNENEKLFQNFVLAIKGYKILIICVFYLTVKPLTIGIKQLWKFSTIVGPK